MIVIGTCLNNNNVDNGAKASGIIKGSDDKLFTVSVTKSAEAGGFVASKTYEEVLEAYQNDKQIVVFLLKIGNIRYQITDVFCHKFSGSSVPHIIATTKGISRHPDMISICYTPDQIYVSGDYAEFRSMPYDAEDTESSATVPNGDNSIWPPKYTKWNYGVLSNLTITDYPDEDVWEISFTSGAAPTLLTLPAGVVGATDFAPAANTKYMIQIAFGVMYYFNKGSIETAEEDGE